MLWRAIPTHARSTDLGERDVAAKDAGEHRDQQRAEEPDGDDPRHDAQLPVQRHKGIH